MSTIKIKNSTTPSSVPSAASLSQGELAVNIADKKLFVGNASGDPVELTNQGVLSVNGATGDITNVAKTNTAQTFTGLQTFSDGITAPSANLATIFATTIGMGTVSYEGPVYAMYNAGGTDLVIQSSTDPVKIGDPDAEQNGVYLVVDDTNQLVEVVNADFFAPNIVNSVNGATGDVIISASGSGFTYTSSAPGSPEVGDRWMDSDTGKEYVYINDGDSSQWIQPVSSNGLIGVTYDPNTETYEVDANIEIQGYVSSDTGFQITSGAINSQSGTTYTLLGSDNGKVIVWNTASSATLTVPSGLAVGYNTTLIQTGTGGIGITGSGTTLNSFEGKLTTAGQHAAVSLISYSSNVFNIAGGLTG